MTFLVLSAILAYASAEYPLPHSFYAPPPPKPHSVYGVPAIHKTIVEHEPIVFDFPKKPETIFGVPEIEKVPDLSYIVPEIHHHEVIPHKIPSKPVVSHYSYELPQHSGYTPPKYEVPTHHYPHPAPVYGLPAVF